MVNFIIYDKDKSFRELYISIILKIIGNKNLAYEIIELEKCTDKTVDTIKNLCGKKIFIVDVEGNGLSGLDLIKRIRDDNDWESPIIISTTHDKLEYSVLSSRLLVLSYVSKYFDCGRNVKDSLLMALRIIDKNKSLNFQYNGEIYQIPFKDILYIERNTDIDISIIHAKNRKIEINKTINELEDILRYENAFLKTHRSCIVNIQNITDFKLDDSIIKFDKKTINLITRDKKKELKDILLHMETINT